MPPLPPDRRLRGPATALVAAGALLCLRTAYPAGAAREPIQFVGFNNTFTATTLSTENLELTQGSTVLKASKAEAAGVVDGGNFDNTTWVLTGNVHLEFEDGVLDTQSATVVFADRRLQSVQVQPGAQPGQAKSPVHLVLNSTTLDAQKAFVTFVDNKVQTAQMEGAPAQFSHQLKNSARRVSGHANQIEYDAGKSLISFSGAGEFTTGSSKYQAEQGIYNFAEDSFKVPSRSSGVIGPEERPHLGDKVPAPRTPDRETAR